MWKEKLLIFILTLFLFTPLSAQKKEISQALSNIKSSSKLDNAESSMRELLQDSLLSEKYKLKAHLTLAKAIKAQYDQASKKLYLNEEYDTAKFFELTKRMFSSFESLDSTAMLQIKKGKKVPYRNKNSKLLSKSRINLYNGGIYFLNKADYDNAYGMMDAYVDCKNQPLFTQKNFSLNDSLSQMAIFSTIYSGYMLSKCDSALKYKEVALKSDKYKKQTLRLLASLYQMKKDTLSYVSTLKEGFKEDGTSSFFVTRIVDYYQLKNQLDSALNTINTALQYNPNEKSFLIAKGNVLLNMGKYDECIAISDSTLAIDPMAIDALFNAGTSYFNQAILISKEALNDKQLRQKESELYSKALPYLEKYQECEPEKINKWAPMLYNIYLNLNMGDKFEKISEILKESEK